jgi:hypothetical protein
MTCSEAAGQLLELRSQLDENENDGNAGMWHRISNFVKQIVWL